MDSIPVGRGRLAVNDTHPEAAVYSKVNYEPIGPALIDVGIFKDTLLPSFALHSGLALIAYSGGRYTNRIETKDWLWPSGQLINAWWSSVGRRLANGVPPSKIWPTLSRPECLMLAGVTLWGGRLFYRLLNRSVKRGKDDPRYDHLKEDPNFWNEAIYKLYIPEAVFQSLICLPFTAPFRHTGAVLTGYHPWIQAFSVGLFSAGLALETIADYQLDHFKKQPGSANTMMREGVWSIVRHPNYLGDTLVHLSFPLLLYGSDLLAPIELIGPLMNYFFLRYIGGDKEKEAHQRRRYSSNAPEKFADFEKFRKERNSFWPNVEAASNKWTWIVVGCGVAGMAAEHLFVSLF